MTVLSLFDGIACGMVALEEAGIAVTNYYASEIDKYAMKIAKAVYPDIVELGDVTKIDFREYDGKIDLLIAGFPCTDLSVAGKRKGLEGEQSRLFWYIVQAIREVRPRWFFIENVASMPKEAKETIGKALGYASGYSSWGNLYEPYVEAVRINSSLLTAQMRDRLYFCNWNIRQPDDKKIYLKDILEDGFSAKDKSYCLNADYMNGASPAKPRRRRTLIQVASLYPNNNEAGRIYSINGKARTLKSESGGGGGKTGLYTDGIAWRKLTVRECYRLQGYPERALNLCPVGPDGVSRSRWYHALGNGFTVPVVAHCLRENRELMEYSGKDRA